MTYRLHGFPEELEVLSFKDLPRLENMYYTIYKPMFPKHSYTELIATMLQSLKQIEVGGHYIDFTAPGLRGESRDVIRADKRKGGFDRPVGLLVRPVPTVGEKHDSRV